MDTFKSIRQGSLAGTRAGGDKDEKPIAVKSGLINSEDVVGRIYFAISPYLPENMKESDSQKMQAKIYEIVKDEISQALIRIRKEGIK